MIPLAIAIFLGWVVARTGPAFVESRERRRVERDRPLAKVIYLPSASCRGDTVRDVER